MTLRRFDPVSGSRKKPSQGLSRILYVEDEDANWHVTQRYLRHKFQLTRANSSAEVFDLVQKQRFDLLLLDIELAGSNYDGLAICRILRGTEPSPAGIVLPLWIADVPIVFVTAYMSRYPRQELLQMGGNEVVTKPVDYTRLLLVSSRLIVSKVHDSGVPTNPPMASKVHDSGVPSSSPPEASVSRVMRR